MTGHPDDRSDLERELADAHAQLLERDWEIRVLRDEVVHWRTELDAILATRVWRTAERFRRVRQSLRRRAHRPPPAP